MQIGFAHWNEFLGWDREPAFLKSFLVQHGCRSVLEVGSGANPTLDADYVSTHLPRYVTSDLSQSELEKARVTHERVVLNLCAPNLDPIYRNQFDCVFSRMVGEHIQDGEQYHKNIFKMLHPGGLSVHWFSTLGAFPFLVNRVVPDFLGDYLLAAFAPRDAHKHGKFKAYYSWGRGPTKVMIARFQALGYEVVRYIGYFGHGYYRDRMAWLDRAEQRKSQFLVRHPVPHLCSYAMLILRKPRDSREESGPLS
jgi:hypothetical protein